MNQSLNCIELLTEASSSKSNGSFQFSGKGVSWKIYLEQGQLKGCLLYTSQEQILNSSYFKVVASLAQAALVGGLIEPEEIAEHSINLTDQLIAKVSQKLETTKETKSH